MNQILYTQNKNKGNSEVRGIVIFFAVAIIIFGISFTAQGSYALISNSKVEEDSQEIGPNIQVDRNDAQIKISLESQKPIYTVAYNWNGEDERTIDAGASTSFETNIDLPKGTNILNITVIDINQKSYQYQKEYYVETPDKPTIELFVTNQNQIRMTAEDAAGLTGLVYTWNNDQPITVQPSQEDNRKIEATVDIPIGQNTLNVSATNQNNKQTIKTIDIKGVKKPIITLLKEADGLYIKVEDELGIKEINYTLNGNRYTINSSYFGTDNKVVEYKQQLQSGENYIILDAINESGIVGEYKGKCVYP